MANRTLGARITALLNTAWLRPVLFLVFLVALWDFVSRIFTIRPYKIPKPINVLWTLGTDGPDLLQQAVPTTIATIEGFFLSAVFGVVGAVLLGGWGAIETYVSP